VNLKQEVVDFNKNYGEAWYAFDGELRAYCKDMPEEGYYILADFGSHPDGRRRASIVAKMFNALSEGE
jgi:hypothetical protein